MKKYLIVMAALCPGCATIVDSGPEFINFDTSTGEEIRVQITSKIGTQRYNIPNAMSFPKSQNDIIIKVPEDECHYPTTTIVPRQLNGWLIGNILFGGIIGLAVDAISDSAYTYPSHVIVNIDMKESCLKQ
jgi:hypothetical protein